MSDSTPAPDPQSPALEGTPTKPKRRARYQGTHPRRFDEKYKEFNPDKYPATVAKVLASGKTPAGMHRPVMMQEILSALAPKPGEVGVDCTLGYGGHTVELWKRIQPEGTLLVFDVDPVELPRTEVRLRELLAPTDRLIVIAGNFAGLPRALASRAVTGIDFLLADLGVSSMQLDDPTRGFSFKKTGPLDLRMNPNRGQSAAALLRTVEESKLSTLLQQNADEPRAAIIARAVVATRSAHPIETTPDLANLVERALRALPGTLGEEDLRSTIQRVFQAIRIAVNEEFNALDALLRNLPGCLNSGARVAILTFHSGEDRRVKQAFEQGWRAGLYSDICREVVRPSADERHVNPRASCAKLRWAVRSSREGATMPMDPATAVPKDHPLLEFRSSGIHGTGAYAKVPIPEQTEIIEYLGERITKEESLRRCMGDNQYIFTLDDDSDLDGDVAWNPARHINHSCGPSCEAINDEGHLWIVSQRDIAAGEEVTFNYGFDLSNYLEYPCACGSSKCVGYIAAEEFHDQIRERKASSETTSPPAESKPAPES